MPRKADVRYGVAIFVLFAIGEWRLALVKGTATHLGETSLAHYLLF